MRSRAALLLFLLVAVMPAARARAGGEVRLLTDDAIPRDLARGQELARAEQWDKVVDVLHRGHHWDLLVEEAELPHP